MKNKQEVKLESVARLIAQADDLDFPVGDDFFDRMHSQIMSGIEDKQIEKVSALELAFQRTKRYMQAHWRSWTLSGFSVSVFLFLGYQASFLAMDVLTQTRTVQVVKNEKAILSNVLHSTEDYTTSVMSGYQSQDDFLMEVAGQSHFSAKDQEHLLSEN